VASRHDKLDRCRRRNLSVRINRSYDRAVLTVLQRRRQAHTVPCRFNGSPTIVGHDVFRRRSPSRSIPAEEFRGARGVRVDNNGHGCGDCGQRQDNANDPTPPSSRRHCVSVEVVISLPARRVPATGQDVRSSRTPELAIAIPPLRPAAEIPSPLRWRILIDDQNGRIYAGSENETESHLCCLEVAGFSVSRQKRPTGCGNTRQAYRTWSRQTHQRSRV